MSTWYCLAIAYVDGQPREILLTTCDREAAAWAQSMGPPLNEPPESGPGTVTLLRWGRPDARTMMLVWGMQQAGIPVAGDLLPEWLHSLERASNPG